MSLFREIMSIFIEEQEKVVPQQVSLHSMKEHYVQELEKVYFDDIFVGVEYGEIKTLLHLYKYQSRGVFALQFASLFGDMVDRFFEEEVEISRDNVKIVAVPMHWTRFFIR